MNANKQGRSGKNGEWLGIPITPGQLEAISDAGMFRLLATIASYSHPEEKPDYYIGRLLGIDRKTVQNIINDHSHPTLADWRILAVEFPIVREYIRVQFNFKESK